MADFNFLKISPIKTNLLTIMKGCVERKPTALFLILGWILGLFDMRKTGLLYKLYSGFLLLFHIISYFIGIFAICPHAPKAEQSKGLTSAKEVLGIILTLSLFFTVLSLVFWNSKCFHELMELIAEFDRSFASAPENGYVMFFIAIVELSLLTILQSSIIGGNTTSKINEFLFGQGLQRMTMSTAYYLRWVLTLRVDRRFIVLNRCLEKLFHKKNRHEIISENQLSDFTIIFRNTRNESHDKNKHFLNSLKKISKFHNSMCDALNLLNKIFGLNMMCEVVFTIAFVSQSTMNVIVQSEDFMENSGINRGTTSCLILVDISVKVFLLALTGDRIARNAQDIVPICYRILHQLDSNLILESHLLKKELKMLIKQVIQRKPCLDAAGFFVVNFNMLGFVITSFTSYIIVAIQFLLKDTK